MIKRYKIEAFVLVMLAYMTAGWMVACGGDVVTEEKPTPATSTGTSTSTGSGTGTAIDCSAFDYCVDDQGTTISGCGQNCGGIMSISCPNSDLVCINQPFASYDGGTICVTPHALTCVDDCDCLCMPSLQGCVWEDKTTSWSCVSNTCMAYCYQTPLPSTCLDVSTGTGT